MDEDDPVGGTFSSAGHWGRRFGYTLVRSVYVAKLPRELVSPGETISRGSFANLVLQNPLDVGSLSRMAARETDTSVTRN